MSKNKDCRCLTSDDSKELHQFADTFSRYMKSKSRDAIRPKLRKMMANLKRSIDTPEATS